jgi:hypothetical protein
MIHKNDGKISTLKASPRNAKRNRLPEDITLITFWLEGARFLIHSQAGI